MALFKTTGKIYFIDTVKTGTSKAGKEWRSQTVIIAADQFADGTIEYQAFTAFNDRCDRLAHFKAGQDAEVTFALSAREYAGKWYTDVRLVNIDTPATPYEAKDKKPAADRVKANNQYNPDDLNPDKHNDLPF